MSRAVCGICWCPYDDDGKCGCTPQRTPSLKSAAQAALDAIERGESFAHLEEIVARSLRTALAEHPAEQEPFGEVAEVAQGYDEGWTAIIETGLRKLQKGDKVYTAPQPAKPAGQEPVAWMYFDSDGDAIFGHPNGYRPDDAVPVYTAPQPAKREPLTETTVFELIEANTEWKPAAGQWRLNEVEFARAIEAAVWGDTR